jgi:Rps23 Pro-64 3,4-dihydroxylase Tpa1-like proline 4-hydroxylase
MMVRPLVDRGGVVEGAFDGLSDGWPELVDQVISPTYRRVLGDLLTIDLVGTSIEARLCRYSHGCWMAPHTDNLDKVATQIIYFNPEWRYDWGGCLRLLRSNRSGDVASEILPLLGTSVILVRSDQSWHEVAPVSGGIRATRLSLLVHFLGAGAVGSASTSETTP